MRAVIQGEGQVDSGEWRVYDTSLVNNNNNNDNNNTVNNVNNTNDNYNNGASTIVFSHSSSTSIIIPSNTLKEGRVYRIEFEYGEIKRKMEVSTVGGPLCAIINGGSHAHMIGDPLILNGSMSFDSMGMEERMEYRWTCSVMNGRGCSSSPCSIPSSSLPATSIVLLNTSSMLEGDYLFTLSLFDPLLLRSSSDSILISLSSSLPTSTSSLSVRFSYLIVINFYYFKQRTNKGNSRQENVTTATAIQWSIKGYVKEEE